jgi:flagellar hook-associated protein 2
VLNQASTASATFTRLSDVGITMKQDGTLEVASTKLDNALNNLPELKKLLATNGADTASSGFALRWKSLADAALSTSGTFKTRTNSLNDRLSRNGKSQDALQMRLAQTESRMRAQYTALDTKMSQLNNLSSYMTQQIAQYNKTSTG